LSNASPAAERATTPAATSSVNEERIAQLEATVAELSKQMEALNEKIDNLFG
jgi:uncharacterized protein YceH (UPF0502 family)